MYVLDTDVVSALRRPDRAPAVADWARHPACRPVGHGTDRRGDRARCRPQGAVRTRPGCGPATLARGAGPTGLSRPCSPVRPVRRADPPALRRPGACPVRQRSDRGGRRGARDDRGYPQLPSLHAPGRSGALPVGGVARCVGSSDSSWSVPMVPPPANGSWLDAQMPDPAPDF
jgi:hypothetical protein